MRELPDRPDLGDPSMFVQIRMVMRVRLTPVPCYTIVIPYVADPTTAVRIVVPIKARVTTKQQASEAAIREMNQISHAELQALVQAQLHSEASSN
jgi:hypothetical protein